MSRLWPPAERGPSRSTGDHPSMAPCGLHGVLGGQRPPRIARSPDLASKLRAWRQTRRGSGADVPHRTRSLVDTFSSGRADQSLGAPIPPRRACSNGLVANAHGTHRTNRRPIAIMRRSCSDSLLTASQSDVVFGSDTRIFPTNRSIATGEVRVPHPSVVSAVA